MQRVPLNGIQQWFEVTGSGPPVVLLPGCPGLAADYLEPLARLVGDLATVVRFDPRGCGQSARANPTRWRINSAVHAATRSSWRRFIMDPALLHRIAVMTMRYLAIVGSEDVRPSWPIAQVAALAPRGRLEVLDDAGHIPWLTHPSELRSAIGAFLGR